MTDAADPSDGTPAKGVDYFQAPRPEDWQLADEADLPNGRHVAGAKARVYHLLELAGERSHRFPIGRHLAPAGWVPTWVLREPWAGGAAGDRRVRDLRKAGVSIEGVPFQPDDCETASWVWRLGCAGRRIPHGKPQTGGDHVLTAPPSGPLAHLQFRTAMDRAGCEDWPAVDVLVDPVFDAAGCDEEAYRCRLLERWHDGSLLASVQGERHLLLIFPARLEPLAEVLAAALSRLGARRV